MKESSYLNKIIYFQTYNKIGLFRYFIGDQNGRCQQKQYVPIDRAQERIL